MNDTDVWDENDLIDGKYNLTGWIEEAENNFYSKCKLNKDGSRSGIPRVRPWRHKWMTRDEKRCAKELERLTKGLR